jgi:hypothetical protein
LKVIKASIKNGPSLLLEKAVTKPIPKNELMDEVNKYSQFH